MNSVLLVSDQQKLNILAASFLPVYEYWPVDTVSDAGSAKRRLLENPYDIVIINTPLPDQFGTELAIDICSNSGACVMLLVKNDMFDDINAKVIDYGVVTVSKPTSKPVLAQSLRIMCATRQRLKQMESRQKSVEKKIEEIRIINKAKWLLIGYMKMNEETAQHYIEKIAMDTRQPRMTVAENIVKRYQDYH